MVRHKFGNLESQKQAYFWYGMKNRRTGAVAIINPPNSPKKRERKTKRKKARKEGREGSNPLIWSPAAAVNSALLKQPVTRSPSQKKNEKKTKKKHKHREERARNSSSGVLLL